MDKEAEDKKAKLHLIMKALYPGCKYALLVNDPKDPDILEVSATFERDDFLDILTDLAMSMLDGTAEEHKRTILGTDFSSN